MALRVGQRGQKKAGAECHDDASASAFDHADAAGTAKLGLAPSARSFATEIWTAGLVAVVAVGGVMPAFGAATLLAIGAVALLAIGPISYAGLTQTLRGMFAIIEKSAVGGAPAPTKHETPCVVGAADGTDGVKQHAASAAREPEKPGQPRRAVDSAAPNWKPFPWNWLPNRVAFALGLVEVLFIAPLTALLIASVVPIWTVMQAAWRLDRCARVRAVVPELVRSVSRPLGRLMLRDPRNHSYLPWMAFLGTVPPALFLWAMRRHAEHGLEFGTLICYNLLRLGPRFRFFAHCQTLVHKEGHDHKGFFRAPFEFLNCATEWWLAPFYGVVPNMYSQAHMKIHHRWHNDVDDVTTTLDLDRSKLSSFIIYTPRFTLYWTGVSPALLFMKRKEWACLRKLLLGMAAYYATMVALWCWDPLFCLGYWVYPHVEAIMFMSAISWLWHAFVEESDPGNQYVNSVTIVDGHDNIWNEDYHVVHHHSPGTHWTDIPAHYEANRHSYAAATATIFRDTEEGMLLKWLFQNDWDSMAEHFVDLNGKLSHEEKKELLVRRLRVIVGETGRDGCRLQREWASTATIRNFESQ